MYVTVPLVRCKYYFHAGSRKVRGVMCAIRHVSQQLYVSLVTYAVRTDGLAEVNSITLLWEQPAMQQRCLHFACTAESHYCCAYCNTELNCCLPSSCCFWLTQTHTADIGYLQDVAIAYGYNNVGLSVPATVTVGKELPLNQLVELLRVECAMCGFTEILTWALCSRSENFGHLRRQDDGNTAVSIGNPATAEFEVCRTSLLQGEFYTSNPL